METAMLRKALRRVNVLFLNVVARRRRSQWLQKLPNKSGCQGVKPLRGAEGAP